MTDKTQIVVAFPEYEEDRTRLRALGEPLPSKYPGSKVIPCDRCEMMLSVGPRCQEALAKKEGSRLLCPWCMGKLLAEESTSEVTIRHLGNPDAGWEKT